jgi:hypothetical protein
VKNNKNASTESINTLLNGPIHHDGRYWDFLCKAIYKELLLLHETLEQEFENADAISAWIKSVQESGLLTDGKYKQQEGEYEMFFDETVPPAYKRLLHPNIVKIREKAIIISAFCRPSRYHRFLQIEKELRDLFDSRPEKPGSATSSKRSLFSISSTSLTAPTEKFKKQHKKASSAGVFEAAGRLLRFKKSFSMDDHVEEDEVGVNAVMPQEAEPKTLARKRRSEPQSKPSNSTPNLGEESLKDNVRNRTRSLPPIPVDAVNEAMSIYEEIRKLCQFIVRRKPLPESKLTDEAFKIAEIVVKHYLTNELPAKYQSVY